MGRSANVGRFSDSEIESLVEREGSTYSLHQYYLRFGNTSKLGRKTVKTHFNHNEHCGQKLKIDLNGFAFCAVCSKIFNSGKPKDGDHVDKHSVFKELGPPPKRLLPQRWANVGRATSAAP
ncbi:MAG: hypothetical protein ACYDHX_07810 [Methanothrix sp.]